MNSRIPEGNVYRKTTLVKVCQGVARAKATYLKDQFHRLKAGGVGTCCWRLREAFGRLIAFVFRGSPITALNTNDVAEVAQPMQGASAMEPMERLSSKFEMHSSPRMGDRPKIRPGHPSRSLPCRSELLRREIQVIEVNRVGSAPVIPVDLIIDGDPIPAAWSGCIVTVQNGIISIQVDGMK
jgi:hypothetical protein